MPDMAKQDLIRLEALAFRAIAEDMGDGDVTSEALFGMVGEEIRAEVVCGGSGILCGIAAVELTAHCVDSRIRVQTLTRDGERVQSGDVVAVLEGSAKNILIAERTLLNFLCHMSGIATLSAKFVEAVKGTAAKVYDTRKTLPGLRWVEKYAVRCGGALNHRMGLDDMGMIKDNHIAAARKLSPAMSVKQMVEKIKLARKVPVALEVQPGQSVTEAVLSGAEIILLDNMSVSQLSAAVAEAKNASAQAKLVCPQLEASGGVSLGTIAEIARTGVDRISVGALTHSAPALAFSLDVKAS